MGGETHAPAARWRWRAGAAMWWRATVASSCALSLLALGTWWAVTDPDLRALGHLPGLALGLLAVACAASAWRSADVELLHDAAGWRLVERFDAGAAASAVRLEVAIDLGVALLLRAVDEQGRSRWLPVDRGAVGPHWQALRRAVYSPRRAGGAAAAVDRPHPQE